MTILPALALLLAAPAATAPPAPGWTRTADLALTVPVVAVATVTDAVRLKGEAAAGAPAGRTRFYVSATVDALIRGSNGLPGRVAWLADLAPDAHGRPPKLKKTRVILFAAPVAGRPGELRLATPDAQWNWDQASEARVRSILTAAAAADAPPVVTGVGNAFHVPGALPGESETQIFLTTADGRPVSLNVLRRPGEQPRWAVALGEIVDESAAPPEPDTLLWYRLACTLPQALPEASTTRLPANEAEAARTDYAVVIAGLGRCARD